MGNTWTVPARSIIWYILRGLASAHRKSSVCDVKIKTITTQTDFQTSIPSNIHSIINILINNGVAITIFRCDLSAGINAKA